MAIGVEELWQNIKIHLMPLEVRPSYCRLYRFTPNVRELKRVDIDKMTTMRVI